MFSNSFTLSNFALNDELHRGAEDAPPCLSEDEDGSNFLTESDCDLCLHAPGPFFLPPITRKLQQHLHGPAFRLILACAAPVLDQKKIEGALLTAVQQRNEHTSYSAALSDLISECIARQISLDDARTSRGFTALMHSGTVCMLVLDSTLE